MSGPPRASSVLLTALVVVVAAAGLWQLLAPGGVLDDDVRDDARDPSASEDPITLPTLEGSGAAPVAEPPVDVAPATASPDVQPTDAALLPVATAAPDGAVFGPLFALAPGTVEDRIAANARPPIVLPRSYVVGSVGPYGVREGPGSGGAFDWSGVARLERETRAESEAEDDTQEPITTAVFGVVVAEDGSPIVGAEVILYSSFYLRQAYYDHRVRQIGRVLTDADGAFDMRPIDLDTVHFGADGDVLVTVRHAHYPDIVAQLLPGIIAGQESDVGTLVLPAQSARVFGVITDTQGKPVEGAAVRASGAMNPVEYDKTERMVVLDACPTVFTDAEGRYDLTDFAGGYHEISIHVHIDCVVHQRALWTGEREWTTQVMAGNGIRGRVVDPNGEPVAAAVVSGGGNWTPTNPDGTFWLDNIRPGPLTLEVAHHLWRTVYVPDVATNADEVELAFAQRLPRVMLEVVDESESPVVIVTIDWVWPEGRGPGPFAPDSRHWHDARGVFDLIIPEGAVGALVSKTDGSASAPLTPDDFTDGGRVRVVLVPSG